MGDDACAFSLSLQVAAAPALVYLNLEEARSRDSSLKISDPVTAVSSFLGQLCAMVDLLTWC